MSSSESQEYARPEDHVRTSGPADLARLLGPPSRVGNSTRPPNRVSTWRKSS